MLESSVKEYFKSGRKRLVRVNAREDHTLLLEYDNGEKRLYDVKPLEGVFACLKPLDVFRRVYIDDCGCVAWDKDPNIDSSKAWSNKISLCPDSCYLDSTPVSRQQNTAASE